MTILTTGGRIGRPGAVPLGGQARHRAPRLVVNQAYCQQRVTGQQRYATEIASRLAYAPGVATREPSGLWASARSLVWLWVLAWLPLGARGKPVLSMTSRAPVWSRRHVLVVHDLFVLEHPEWFSRWYAWTHAWLLRAQIRTASEVVAVSRPVADKVASLRGARVAVAPNAPSDVFRHVDDVPSQVLTDHDVRPGSYFLAVASRDPRKNLCTLAAAYGSLPAEERRRHPLVVVGGHSSVFRDDGVTWPTGTVEAGYVDDEELARLYRDAGVFVLVSLAEGFGLPLVEASAAGARGLVASDIEVFRWVCGDHASYVDPADPGSVATGLRAAMSGPPRAPLDPDRFDWASSATVIARACARAAG